ncbi:MAG: hypothetical protein KF819_23085 [Labilithrix sp.]|nr:hypothetical protein [Labilithrix sp.]
MRGLAMIDGWLRPRVPVARLDAVRILVGAFALVYLVVRFRYFADLSRHAPSELSPVGIARILSAPLPAWSTWTIAALAVAFGAAFVRGVRLRASAPAFFVALLWVTTYRSSWGKILHSENLVVLHVGILAIGAIASSRSTGEDAEREAGWVLRTIAIVTVLTYLVAGVAKLRSGGAAWISGEALGRWVAFDALRKIELGSLHSPLAAWLASQRGLLRVLAIFALLVELGAPLALVSARAGRVWAALAWSFHAGVLATMAIGFFYPLAGVAFAAFFPVERLPIVRRLTGR